MDFRWGDSAGYVRFRSADAAKAAAAALSASAGGEAVSEARGGKMEGASWRLLSDVEAEEYREAVAAKKGKRAPVAASLAREREAAPRPRAGEEEAEACVELARARARAAVKDGRDLS